MREEPLIFAVDAGNSRIKWGLHGDSGWQRQGWVKTEDAAELKEAWREIEAPRQIIVSNVAGEETKACLEAALKHWGIAPQWIHAQDFQCGVSNGYDQPEQLGADRWAALIAARHLHKGCCLVVTIGTALTADALSQRGEFLGGMIVPGLTLMREALAGKTAGIAPYGGMLAQGGFKPFPTNTADAVYSGALCALAGTVKRMAAQLAAASGTRPLCILSGGAAHLLLPHLNIPLRRVDNLVLEGLIRIAQEGNPNQSKKGD